MQNNDKYSYIKNPRSVSVDGFIPNNNQRIHRPGQRLQKKPSVNRTGSAPGSMRPIDSFSKSLDGFKPS